MLFGCNRPLARPWECSLQSGGQNSHIFWHENLNSQKRKFRLSCPPDWLHSHDVQGVYSRCIADVFRMGLGADSNRWEGGVGDLRCASTDRCICLHISDAKQRSPNRNKRKQLFIVFIHMTDTEASMGISYEMCWRSVSTWQTSPCLTNRLTRRRSLNEVECYEQREPTQRTRTLCQRQGISRITESRFLVCIEMVRKSTSTNRWWARSISCRGCRGGPQI